MQGLYRFALAMMVVIHHLANDYAYFAGNFAVLGFYALSAYLITGALERNYGLNRESLMRFAVNRVLRIFPAYWAILAFAAITVLIFPRAAAEINPVMRDPSEFELLGLPLGWLPQITMVGLQTPPGLLFPIRLIPPAWSTAIELYFYAALCIAVLVPTKRFKWVLLLCGLLGLICASTGQFRWTYTSLPGVAVLFAAGSYAWRMRDDLQALVDRASWLLPTALVGFLLMAFLPELSPLFRQEAFIVWGQYFSVPFVAVLAHATVTKKALLPAKIDKLLADLSYPVFLAHYPVAGFVRGLGFDGLTWLSVSFLATIGLSLLVVYAVEKPIQGLRRRIRGSAIDRVMPSTTQS